MKVDATAGQNFEQALGLKWLETNGRGGFASDTVAGANTTRYHTLLLTARKPPSERFVFVNHLEAWIDIEGQLYPISTSVYPNAIHPEGYKQCTGFTTDPWPTWTYDCHGTVVQQEVFCVRYRDLVTIRWMLVGKTKKAITLPVRPRVNGRDEPVFELRPQPLIHWPTNSGAPWRSISRHEAASRPSLPAIPGSPTGDETPSSRCRDSAW